MSEIFGKVVMYAGLAGLVGLFLVFLGVWLHGRCRSTVRSMLDAFRRLRGAADDWVRGATTNLSGVVFADGRLQDAVCDPQTIYAPLWTSLGVVPEANWGLVDTSSAASRVWYGMDATGAVAVTWQDVLLARATNMPVSLQALFGEDGLATRDEVCFFGTDPGLADTDCDGLSDFEEVVRGTSPLVPDTDGDGLVDGVTNRTDVAYATFPSST